MTLENIHNSTIYRVLDRVVESAASASDHIRTRILYRSPLRNKRGVYLSASEVNKALDNRIKILPDADNSTRNMI